VQEIDGALRVGCGLNDGALVVLEDFEPGGDVRRVVVSNFRRQLQFGAEESGPQLGYQLLPGIAFVAPGLAAEVALSCASVA